MGDLWEIWVVMLYRNHDNSWAPLLKISGEMLRLAVGTWAVCGTRAAVPCIAIWRCHFLQLVQVARLKFPWIYRTTIIWQRRVHRLRCFVLEIPLCKNWHFLHRVHGVTMQHGTKGGIVIYFGGEPRRLRNLVTGLIIINHLQELVSLNFLAVFRRLQCWSKFMTLEVAYVASTLNISSFVCLCSVWLHWSNDHICSTQLGRPRQKEARWKIALSSHFRRKAYWSGIIRTAISTLTLTAESRSPSPPLRTSVCMTVKLLITGETPLWSSLSISADDVDGLVVQRLAQPHMNVHVRCRHTNQSTTKTICCRWWRGCPAVSHARKKVTCCWIT